MTEAPWRRRVRERSCQYYTPSRRRWPSVKSPCQ